MRRLTCAFWYRITQSIPLRHASFAQVFFDLRDVDFSGEPCFAFTHHNTEGACLADVDGRECRNKCCIQAFLVLNREVKQIVRVAMLPNLTSWEHSLVVIETQMDVRCLGVCNLSCDFTVRRESLWFDINFSHWCLLLLTCCTSKIYIGLTRLMCMPSKLHLSAAGLLHGIRHYIPPTLEPARGMLAACLAMFTLSTCLPCVIMVAQCRDQDHRT